MVVVTVAVSESCWRSSSTFSTGAADGFVTVHATVAVVADARTQVVAPGVAGADTCRFGKVTGIDTDRVPPPP